MQVFRTPKKGWAVRSGDFIPSGAPVCEYIGVLRRTDELDNVADNDYIFEIDCLQTMKEIGGREVLAVLPCLYYHIALRLCCCFSSILLK